MCLTVPSHPVTAARTSFARRRLSWLLSAAAMASALVACGTATEAEPGIPAAERQALIRLHERTLGPQWTEQAGWLGAAGSECDWHGVRCDAARRHVVGLNLANNQLRGRLPSLDGLTQLRVLNVALNHLDGPLPSLRGLPALRELKAHNNLLQGPLPSWRHLSQLERVVLANNRIDGPVPPFTGLTALREVDLSNNRLGGAVPSTMGLPLLKRFDVSFNRLQDAPEQVDLSHSDDRQSNGRAAVAARSS